MATTMDCIAGHRGTKIITYTLSTATAEATVGQEWVGRTVTIQTTGTAGAGLSVSVQCSNDGGTTWVNVPTAVTISAVGVSALVEANKGFLLYRLNKTAGHATTDITVTVVATP